MGRYFARINNKSVEMGDWVFEYVKDKQPKKYYESYMLNAALEEDGEEKEIQIPLLRLGNISKNIKTYSFEPDFDNGFLHKWLWDEHFKSGTEVHANLQLFYKRFYNKSGKEVPYSERPTYYLASPIGDPDIKISLTPVRLKLTEYEQFEWLELNYFVSRDCK